MANSWEQQKTKKVRGILDAIPGYTGYREKERRRDVDRQVREKLADRFSADADRVEAVGRKISAQRNLKAIGPVEDLTQAIRLLTSRISTATYGYGGLFGDRPIGDNSLDQIRIFDESLFASADGLDSALSKVEAAQAGGAYLAGPLARASEIVRSASARLDTRSQIFETGTPASPAAVSSALAVLDSPAEQIAANAPLPIFDLQSGDTLSILADNYVVDSRIDIKASGAEFRLFRLGASPEKWLFVSNAPVRETALLANSPDSYSESSHSIGRTTFEAASWTSGSGEVAGAGGNSGLVGVSYLLLVGAANADDRAVVLKWSNQTQTMAGSAVHPSDIEVYGRARK